jgi:hypothetical protein
MLRIAVIGCGAVSRNHGKALKNNRYATLEYCVDIIPERAKAFSETYGGIPLTDYRELFDKKKGMLRNTEIIVQNLVRIGMVWVIGHTKKIGGKAVAWLLKFLLKASKFIPGWGTAIGFLIEFAP